jgi:hypothetical protein
MQARLNRLGRHLLCVKEGEKLYAVCSICPPTGRGSLKTLLEGESRLLRVEQHVNSAPHKTLANKAGAGVQLGIESFTRPTSGEHSLQEQEAKAQEVIAESP